MSEVCEGRGLSQVICVVPSGKEESGASMIQHVAHVDTHKHTDRHNSQKSLNTCQLSRHCAEFYHHHSLKEFGINHQYTRWTRTNHEHVTSSGIQVERAIQVECEDCTRIHHHAGRKIQQVWCCMERTNNTSHCPSSCDYCPPVGVYSMCLRSPPPWLLRLRAGVCARVREGVRGSERVSEWEWEDVRGNECWRERWMCDRVRDRQRRETEQNIDNTNGGLQNTLGSQPWNSIQQRGNNHIIAVIVYVFSNDWLSMHAVYYFWLSK